LRRKKAHAPPFLYENAKGRILPLDDIDLDILKSMLSDATISDAALSTELHLTDANTKRRRKIVEDHFLTRNYLLDVSALGWRIGDIQVDVGKGKSEQVAQKIFLMFSNVLEVSLRVNSTATVSARIFYRDNQELAMVIDKIKRLPFVNDVAFSEVIKLVRTRSIAAMKDVFVNRRGISGKKGRSKVPS
jgi:DNA-binding Lrp family transcriptional regulator